MFSHKGVGLLFIPLENSLGIIANFEIRGEFKTESLLLFLWMGDINEVFHLFGNILVLRDLLKMIFKTSVKIKAHLFKEIEEILSVPVDVSD